MERLVHHTRATYEMGFHLQMLLDHSRMASFRRAIARSVRPGSVVVDAGTGSGVLAVIAAQCGAKRVLAIEIDPEAAAVARRNVELSGFAEIIEILDADAASVQLRDHVDVIVCEMLHSWLVEELQAPVMRHLARYLRPGGRMIPEIVENSAALAFVEFVQPGLEMFAPFHRWEHEYEPCRLSEAILVSTERLADLDLLVRCHRVELHAYSSGVANAVALDSRAMLDPGQWLGQTKTLFPTIYIPLRAAVPVEAGSAYELIIHYELGGRWTQVSASAR